MPIIKHVHKLKKIRFKSGNITFFCALPECTFKINPALALGKMCECWRCGKPFSLSEYTLRLVKPHCNECHQPKGAAKEAEPIIDVELDKIPVAMSDELRRSLALNNDREIQVSDDSESEGDI